MTTYYTSNDGTIGFDATSTGALSTDWAQAAGTWQVGTLNLIGGHTHSFGSTSGGNGDVALVTGMNGGAAVADMQVAFNQKATGSLANNMVAPVLRMDSGYNNGYVIVFTSNITIQVFKRIGGNFTQISNSSAAGTFTAGNTVSIKAQAVGTTIQIKFWDATAGAEPASWDQSITDSSVSAAGYGGLYNSGTAAMAVTDFIVTDVPGIETISVDTPATQSVGATFTVTGSYTNGPPTALDFEFDSAGYGAASTPTISGGSFSFSATAPSAGSHTISVRDHTNTSIAGSSGSFTTAAAAIAVTTPGTQTTGASMTVSGTYAGTAPTALDFEFDSAGYGAASTPTIGGGAWSFTTTAPATGTHTVSVRDHNHTSVSGTSGSFTVNATPTISVTTPATQNAGATFTVSGAYTGTAPTALDVEFDAGGYSAVSAPTIGGGTWSFTTTAPAAGSHTVSVRDHNHTSVSATSSSFTTTAETIGVTTPGSQTAGAGMTVSGTYTGTAPLALDVEFDSAGYGAASSPTIGGGTWSFTATAPAAGSHTVSVRDHNNTGVSGTSGSFTTSASVSVTVTTPSGLIIDGQALALSGTYTGTAPTGINVKVDSGGYVAASGFSASGGAWSADMTAPAFGSHTITVQEANSTGTTAASGSFTVSAAPDNAAMVYSPYNWNVGAASAITINPGAYLRTLFSGASCTLNFDASHMASPASEIWWRVDDGPLTQANVASTVAVTIPAATTSNADVPYHLLEVMVKSTTETANRWNSVGSAAGTAVIFQGLTLAAGAALVAPGKAGRNILIYGDSITEGVRTLGESAANDTDRNDAWMGWAYRLGALLGAEVGVVGFGATGITVAGSGNVPNLQTSYNLLYSGAARSFSPTPDLVAFNEGTNDGATNTVAGMEAVLNGIISACSGTPIVVLRPFNGSQAANLQAAIAGCSKPSACHYVDTTGFFDTSKGADSGNLHPSGPNNLALIAPAVAAQAAPIMGGVSVVTYRGGFHP